LTSQLKPGDKVLHQFNRELGPGEVVSNQGGRVEVRFPKPGLTLSFAVANHAFTPLSLPPGSDPGTWSKFYHEDLVERLARLETDTLKAFKNRIACFHLNTLREAQRLGSFLGGRIEIYPHQLHVAEQAVQTDPVRWLLADEVGLGKTVEACLILNHLVRTRRAERALIVTPASLTVQWLGELYRKFHQVFVLMDKDRLQDVQKDLGDDFNPFEVHTHSVVAIEDLVENSSLARQAREAKLDLVIVDEAHRLERQPKHPGNPAYRTLAPLCQKAKHVLLLSATPLEADTYGFFRLLELLRPEAYTSFEAFQASLVHETPLTACTSSTTRKDIGGLPPRRAKVLSLGPWPQLGQQVKKAVALKAHNALEQKRRTEAIWKALSEPTGSDDLRIQWILEAYADWKQRGAKILIFVNQKSSLDFIRKIIEQRTMDRVGVFHEELTPAARDLEVAQFAKPPGPTVLISTEAGGEGRNFEFCEGLVLFDLPWNPALVEQRIGRLDRINRRRDVEVYVFRPQESLSAQMADLYCEVGVFSEPLGAMDRSMAHLEEALLAALHQPEPILDIQALIGETKEAQRVIHRGLYHTLHQNRYTADQAKEILSRIPEELEGLIRHVVLGACRQFGFDVVAKGGEHSWYIEFGNEAILEHLPGVPEGSRFLGSFDRQEAVSHEAMDFFASGHPLVEGVLMELEDSHRGEVTLMDVPAPDIQGAGLAIWLKQKDEYSLQVFDFDGNHQPQWNEWFELEGPWKQGSAHHWGLEDPSVLEEFSKRVKAIVYPCQADGKLLAIAAFRFVS